MILINFELKVFKSLPVATTASKRALQTHSLPLSYNGKYLETTAHTNVGSLLT